MKIYSPRLCLLGCKVVLDWDNRMSEKTLKNNKKMALFDISQFEQLLWTNHWSYVHQILHVSFQGRYPSLHAKKPHLFQWLGIFFGPKMLKYSKKIQKIVFLAAKTFFFTSFVWNFTSGSLKPFPTWQIKMHWAGTLY